ncbi:MAG: PD-(D/E)XK nuclease family transposase, partial [Treponema sp.]|nr:PD-(D/E)XK nuclease family transposase [Treponema sp.]
GTEGWGWTQFLRSERREEFEMAAVRNPEIRKAVDNLYELSADEKVRAEYAMRQKAWRDRISQNEGYYEDGMQEGIQKGMQQGIQKGILQGRQEGIQQGRQEGIQQGRQEGILEIAKRMKARGRSPEEIAEDTGLDTDTIRSL